MGKIVILDENTANKIAAGEVVERPASVVKELVENSIDAKATSINVEIRNGGISYIKVSDNGVGIDDDDVEIAFERHATSKIRSAEELEGIFTMGFRGEALASIASVSRVELVTRPKTKDTGSYIKVEGGRVADFRQTGSPFGTTFTVRDLFYNTPARYKFLKKDTQEASYVSDVLERMAIARPDISFNLKVNNNPALHTPGNNDLMSVIYSIYGKEVSASVVPIIYKDEKVCVEGFVGKPELSRGNRREQSVFVNGRYIKSKVITSALDEAYKTSLMKGRFAFAVINITINPILVDVNVHPTKMEVRFSEEQLIFRAVYHAIQDAIYSRQSVPTVNIAARSDDGFTIKTEKKNYTQQHFEDTKMPSAAETKSVREFEKILSEGKDKFVNELQKVAVQRDYSKDSSISQSRIKENSQPVFKTDMEKAEKEEKAENNEDVDVLPAIATAESEPYKVTTEKKTSTEVLKENSENTPNESETLVTITEEPKKDEEEKPLNLGLSDALLLGQAFNTYIILQKNNELYLVDQHAAHERVIYERIKQTYSENDFASQLLAIPQAVDVPGSEYRIAIENINFFEKIGFIYEDFGNNSLIVRSVPVVLTDTDYIQTLKDILDYISTEENNDFSLIADEALYQVACKAAVKANKRLDEKEIRELISQMEQLNNPYTCPHGRPTVLRLTKYEVEKMFKRAGIS